MIYRILDASEWDRLTPLVDAKFLPSNDSASAAIAEDDDGNIRGILFLQLTLHMEPLILSSPQVSFERLHDTLLNAVADKKGLRIYCFSDKEIIDRMAAHVGMKQLPYRIFLEEVT